MRSLRCNGLSAFAMLVLLLGTAAPALARTTCVMGGHSVVKLGQAEDCSPTDHSHKTTTVSATCCEVLQAQPERTDFVPAAGATVPMLFAVALPAVLSPVEMVAPAVSRDALFSRPPPMPRAQRMATFGIFLI